ncbi:MAG: YeeE/YedE family protein [Polyangiaceae bacterium]|nr:YeeE/YedE family protein [Polyangiaceae bacterium]
MENFTPLASTLGGMLIGLAAMIMLLGLGRIAGISGIFGGLVVPTRGDLSWRLAFVGGLVLGGIAMVIAAPQLFVVNIDRSLVAVASAGLLVGFGTRMGNGCTSGHGVCGLSRFSVRSLVATLTFIATGGITVFITQHVLGGN